MRKYFQVLIGLVVAGTPTLARADVKPNSLFSDHAVLQRGVTVPVWGTARDGENVTVVVSSSEVAKPVAVRYGWANVPDVNLYNKQGLPASPFRTDVD